MPNTVQLPLTTRPGRGLADQSYASWRRCIDPNEEKRKAQADLTVAELCDLYVEACGTKKASTMATDRGRIERHIKPLLGKKKLSQLTRGDLERFLSDVAKGKTAVDVKNGKRSHRNQAKRDIEN